MYVVSFEQHLTFLGGKFNIRRWDNKITIIAFSFPPSWDRPVIQCVENCDDEERDLCGEEEPDDHHQHHRRPLRIFLSLVLPEEMEAASPLVVQQRLPATSCNTSQPLAQQPAKYFHKLKIFSKVSKKRNEAVWRKIRCPAGFITLWIAVYSFSYNL